MKLSNILPKLVIGILIITILCLVLKP